MSATTARSTPSGPLARDATGDGPLAAPATGRRALLVASIATFLAYLDVTVVNVAFPQLERDFPDASLATLSWNVTAYAIAFAALLAPLGRVADLAGRRRVFIGGIALFATGSALAAAAPGVGTLIAARAVQGVGAAAMIPAALGIVLATAAPERRAAAVGVWGAAGSLAAAAGPTVGGVVVDAFGWRAVFLVNVPLAVLAVAGALRWLPDFAPRAERRPDAAGAVLFVASLGVLVVGLTQSGPWGWGDARTLALLVGGLALAAVALTRAARHAAPAVEVRLLGRRPFAIATLGSAFAGAALFAWLLYGIVFLTGVWHYSVLKAGLAVSPGALVSVAASLVAGRATQGGRGGHAVVAGGAIMGAAGFGLAAVLPDTPHFLVVWLPAGILSGAGLALLLTGLVSSGAAALPPERFAAGTGLNLTARQVGGAVGVALGASLLTAAPDDPLAAASRVFALCGAFAVLAGLAGVLLTRTTQEA